MIVHLKTEPTDTPFGKVVGITIGQFRANDLTQVMVRYIIHLEGEEDQWSKRTTFSWETFSSFVEAVNNGTMKEFVAGIIQEETGIPVILEPETQEPEQPNEEEE